MSWRDRCANPWTTSRPCCAGASIRAAVRRRNDLAGLPTLVARTDPDLLILVVPRAGDAELEIVERIGHLYTGMTPLLLCDNQSPEFLLRAMRAGVREILPSATDRRDDPRCGRTRQRQAARAARPAWPRSGVPFLQGGGGGATFLATNVAYALAAEERKRVMLIDLNLQLGDAVFFVSDKKPSITLADLALQIHRVDPAFLTASLRPGAREFGVLAAPEDPVHALDVKPEHIDVLIRLARSHYDYVILDVGRALDAVSVRALDKADTIFPVIQLTLPFIRDGKRLLGASDRSDYRSDKVSLVVNRYEKGGEITLEDMERALGTKDFQDLPNSYGRGREIGQPGHSGC